MTTGKVPNASQRIVAFPAGAEGAGARMDGIVKCAAAFLA